MSAKQPHNRGSLFNTAASACMSFDKSTPLDKGKLSDALAYMGCHNPIFISANLGAEDKEHAQKIGVAVAEILNQSAQDAERPDIKFQTVLWFDKEQKTYVMGIAAGTHKKDAPPLTEIPKHQITAQVQQLRKEIIGTKANVFAPQWESSMVEVQDQGNTQAYVWETSNERDKKLQGVLIRIMDAQGGRWSRDTGYEHNTLHVSTDTLENISQYEHPKIPDRP